MVAFDLLGRRWSLRILWELRTGPAGFRPLQALCDGMSSSVLRQRLLELTEYELVRQAEDGAYELTTMGLELGNAIRPLDQWAQRWVETHTRPDT